MNKQIITFEYRVLGFITLELILTSSYFIKELHTLNNK